MLIITSDFQRLFGSPDLGMGVKGLQEFLETEPSLKVGVSTVDLVRSSWAREGKVTSCDKFLNR